MAYITGVDDYLAQFLPQDVATGQTMTGQRAESFLANNPGFGFNVVDAPTGQVLANHRTSQGWLDDILAGIAKPLYDPFTSVAEHVRHADMGMPDDYSAAYLTNEDWQDYVRNPLLRGVQSAAGFGSFFLPTGLNFATAAGAPLGFTAGNLGRAALFGAGKGAIAGFGATETEKLEQGDFGDVLTGAAVGGATNAAMYGGGQLFNRLTGRGAYAPIEQQAATIKAKLATTTDPKSRQSLVDSFNKLQERQTQQAAKNVAKGATRSGAPAGEAQARYAYYQNALGAKAPMGKSGFTWDYAQKFYDDIDRVDAALQDFGLPREHWAIGGELPKRVGPLREQLVFNSRAEVWGGIDDFVDKYAKQLVSATDVDEQTARTILTDTMQKYIPAETLNYWHQANPNAWIQSNIPLNGGDLFTITQTPGLRDLSYKLKDAVLQKGGANADALAEKFVYDYANNLLKEGIPGYANINKLYESLARLNQGFRTDINRSGFAGLVNAASGGRSAIPIIGDMASDAYRQVKMKVIPGTTEKLLQRFQGGSTNPYLGTLNMDYLLSQTPGVADDAIAQATQQATQAVAPAVTGGTDDVLGGVFGQAQYSIEDVADAAMKTSLNNKAGIISGKVARNMGGRDLANIDDILQSLKASGVAGEQMDEFFAALKPVNATAGFGVSGQGFNQAVNELTRANNPAAMQQYIDDVLRPAAASGSKDAVNALSLAEKSLTGFGDDVVSAVDPNQLRIMQFVDQDLLDTSGANTLQNLQQNLQRSMTDEGLGALTPGRAITEPIEVLLDSNGGMTLMDGHHRVVQAMLNGQQTIPARIKDALTGQYINVDQAIPTASVAGDKGVQAVAQAVQQVAPQTTQTAAPAATGNAISNLFNADIGQMAMQGIKQAAPKLISGAAQIAPAAIPAAMAYNNNINDELTDYGITLPEQYGGMGGQMAGGGQMGGMPADPMSMLSPAGGQQSMGGGFDRQGLFMDLLGSGLDPIEAAKQVEAFAVGMGYGGGGAGMGMPELTSRERETLVSIDNALANVAQLEQMMGEAGLQPGLAGALSGAVRPTLGNLNLDRTAKRFGDFRTAIASSLSRATGETGVLNNFDIQRALNAIPDIGTDPQLAQQKIADLYNLLQGFKSRVINTATMYGG